jgi:hypothetical protein
MVLPEHPPEELPEKDQDALAWVLTNQKLRQEWTRENLAKKAKKQKPSKAASPTPTQKA